MTSTIRRIEDEICEALEAPQLTFEEFKAHMQNNFGYTATDVEEVLQSIAKTATEPEPIRQSQGEKE